MDANVVAVLVTYNPFVHDLKESLQSLLSQLNNIIIVDNASSNADDLHCMIMDHYKDKVEFIPLSSNKGLSAAQNIGIEQAREKKATHVILFDQDSHISPGFIDSLVSTEVLLLSLGEKVAAVGPSFFDSVSLEPYPATVYCGPFIKRVDINEITEATFIIASGCLINMSVIEYIGGMKEDLFIDYIDIEWCLRAKNLGYKVFISPNAKMAHSIGDKRMSIMGRSVSVHNPIRRYYLIRNSFYLMRLSYVPLGYKLREAVFNFLRFMISIASSDDKGTYLKYGFLGIRDGLKGNFGPLQQKK
ncbi:glycosyltransferase family 2 protein [Pectobacterium versatile]|uniref:glycosyltransferase family 2 protein n=1 Tax=Pectobacterium versatile TaxID=2488639 RepID=UPI000D1A2417|nr:glycosyltransferase family 2 protein [Pectobacterium versatile]AVT58115.1 dTDP-rhamnosyl transferase rfbF [Pectobacterium versatile]GBO47340.1 hypothetical protein MFFDBJGM_00334 [Pectobacterium versatile]